MEVENEFLIPQSLEEISEESGVKFMELLDNDHSKWARIPLLNYTPLHNIKDHSIVRFRGMIQDMCDPEIYLERYEVGEIDRKSDQNNVRMQDGRYRDCLVLKNNEEINYNSVANIHSERRTLYLVSIPGLNNWAQHIEETSNGQSITNAATNTIADASKNPKRSAPTDEDENVTRIAGDNVLVNPIKRQCVQSTKSTEESSSLTSQNLLNSPIPERHSKACMVKIYKDFDQYVLNSIIDVVGFLSVDPSLDASTMDVDMCSNFESVREIQAQNPPPSLIPRLHALLVHRVPHQNPLLDNRFLTVSNSEPFSMLSVHKELRMLLTLCLFNDDLAADYMVSHLVSKIYNRTEMQSIGKFALNICNLPKQVLSNYSKKLYEVLELLIPASHYLPMTLEVFNSTTFAPKKDYETNRLVSGLLQLSPHTHLVLDETCMQQGKLESKGVLNVQSVAHLIKHQQIKCDFQFYDIDYNVDVPVLILSEGKSMLPHDFTVPVKADTDSVDHYMEILKAAHHYLQPTRLDQFRRFLTVAKTCEFDVNSTASEMIQDDFVEMRQSNIVSSAEDLHALLVLSRLLAITRGKDKLDKDSWELAKHLEAKRKERIRDLSNSYRSSKN